MIQLAALLKWGPAPLPKEHGAWAMVLTPPIVALLAAGLSRLGLLALLGWFAAYCLRGPVEVLGGFGPTGKAGALQAEPAVARLWLLIFGLLAAALLLPVILSRPAALLWLLGSVVLMAVVVWLSISGQTRSILAGTLGILGLMTGGPLYYIASFGAPGPEGWALALACFAFFEGSVFRVKTLARERRSQSFRFVSVGFHLLAVLLAAYAAWRWQISWLVPVTLVPALGWSVYGALRAGPAVNLMVIGKGEQWLTIGFGLLLAAALRVW